MKLFDSSHREGCLLSGKLSPFLGRQEVPDYLCNKNNQLSVLSRGISYDSVENLNYTSKKRFSVNKRKKVRANSNLEHYKISILVPSGLELLYIYIYI